MRNVKDAMNNRIEFSMSPIWPGEMWMWYGDIPYGMWRTSQYSSIFIWFLVSASGVYIYTTRKQHVHREDDEGPFNSIFRQNQVEVFWAKRMSWQLTNWKFVTRIEKLPLQQKKCNWNIHHHLNHRSEIWQLKSGKTITPLKHRKSPKKTTTRCILLKVPAGSRSWKLWKWTT